jgi:kynurenine 3-monooxygenase
MPNVKFFFNHKLTGADFTKNTAWFEHLSHAKPSNSQGPTQPSTTHQRFPEISVKFDLLIGADGAHSATRYHLMKYARVNYSQEYIDTLWCEFHIPPTPSSTFAISPHHLHIWPSPTSMFIAIPSLDKSFPCTLFAPSTTLSHLRTSPSTLLPQFFTQNFAGVTPDLITTSDLLSQFSSSPHLPLINIRCTPYHHSSSVVILGDAAHAMVPFYGQGMNAGLEDVRVLFDFLTANNVYPPSPLSATSSDPISTRRGAALAAYTNHRTPDAHAINDLALRNYLEMRSLVTSRLYLLRKFIEEALYKYVPGMGWATQYSRVSFGNERYSEVERLAGRQGRILAAWGVGTLMVIGWGVFRVGMRLGLWGGKHRGVIAYWREILGSIRER